MNNQCNNCRFFNRHVWFGDSSAKVESISCELCNKTYNIFNDGEENNYKKMLYKSCPFRKLDTFSEYKNKWEDLKNYIEQTYVQNLKQLNAINDVKYSYWKMILEDVLSKIQSMEENKGEE